MTEKQKRRVPKSQRGVPSKSGTGSFPIPDKARARAALAYIRYAPPAARARIRRLAAKKLGTLRKLKKAKRG